MTFILATGNQHKVGEFKAILESVAQGGGHAVYAYSEFIAPFEVEENGKSFEENAAIKLGAIYGALSEAYRAARGASSEICPDSKSQSLQNAAHGATHASQTQNLKPNIATIPMPVVVLAEDSGICVPLLGGEPGIYSARYAKYKGFAASTQAHNSDDVQNLRCLVEQIRAYKAAQEAREAGSRELGAYFIAYIAAVCSHDFAPLEGKNARDSEKLAMGQIMGFEGRLEGFVIEEARGAHGFGYDPIFVPFEGNEMRENKQDFQTLAEFSPSAKNTLSHRYRATLKCLASLGIMR